MGYRSDITAVFYVSKVEHLPLLKLWLSENFPMDKFHEGIRWFNRGMIFEESDTKWYEDYDEVKAFNKAADNFKDLIVGFNNSSVEDQPMFCYEFVRIGENYEDIETDHCGDHCEFILNVYRSVSIDV
jgi:hypothetical protein